MIYHILPGDAQVEAFKESGIEGALLVCREALVEGDLSGETLDELFINRAAFHNDSSNEDPANYNANVASQFRKLTELTDKDEINLWFEYELFCAANMWFCIDVLSGTGAAIYRVEPIYLSNANRWNGFGRVTADQMRECFAARTELAPEDVALGSELWQAFRSGNTDALRNLAGQISPAFPYLGELCEAAIEKESKPGETVRQIQSEGITDFGSLFAEFKKRAGVYGFGDSQVKRLLSEPPAIAGG
jgi:hypothetical protein